MIYDKCEGELTMEECLPPISNSPIPNPDDISPPKPLDDDEISMSQPD